MNHFWTDKRVLITGASGLVGSWLTRALVERGTYVVALIRDFDPQSELIRSNLYQEINVINGSLEDYSAIERAINLHEIDTVFHLGAQTIVGVALRDPLSTFEANIRGSYNLLEVCRRHSSLVKRVVVASSDKSYGTSETLPYTEEMPPLGKHPYDVSKSCTDLLAQTYSHTYGLPIVIARCGNIYGGGDLNWSRIVPGTIRSLYREEPVLIRSDGKFIRDYIFVQDVVNAYLMLAERLDHSDVKGEAFNFGPNEPFTVLQVVQAIANLMGKQDLTPTILNHAKAEIRDQYLCSSKAHERLNWHSHYSLEQGLGETISWYQEFFKKTTNPFLSLPKFSSVLLDSVSLKN